MKASIKLSNNTNRLFSQSQKNTPLKIGGPTSKFEDKLDNNKSSFKMKRDDSFYIKYGNM